MSNKIECELCHGSGEVSCETCGGTGKVACPTCDGSGKVFSICPDCHEGRVLDPRGADDDDTMPCPTCHGNYMTETGKCKDCNGTGKIGCVECKGGGVVLCPLCEGDEIIDVEDFCASYLSGDGDDLALEWDEDATMLPRDFSMLLKMADAGYAEACFIVGWSYDVGLYVYEDGRCAMCSGDGVIEIAKKNAAEAVKYYRICAGKGMVAAQKKLALLLLDGCQSERGRIEGAKWLATAAENGSEDALLPLSFLSLCGLFGCEKSLPNALAYFKRYTEVPEPHHESWGNEVAQTYMENLESALGGSVQAILKLADLHSKDWLDRLTGRYFDFRKYWLEMAGENGCSEAASQLAKINKDQDLAASVTMLDKAAQAGDKTAKEQLKALMLECTKKQSRFDELKRVADSGNVAAMKFIASVYKEGTAGNDAGTRDKMATEWYQKAADAGDGEAMLDLSLRYRDGKGCAKDINRAFALTVEGFEKGGLKRRAIRLLAEYYRWGHFAAPDYGKAIALYTRSANAGYAASMVALGKCYVDGLGVEKDLCEAKRLFEMAAAKKSKDAGEELKRLPADIKASKKPVSGVTGTPSKGPLPGFVLKDYEKAKSGSLWTQAFEDKKKAMKKAGKMLMPASQKKRWKFVLLGIFFGILGLHFLYARRKGWFALYWLLMIANVVHVNVPAVANLMPALAKVPIFGVLAALTFVGSLFFMKKDGDGNRM